MKTVDVSIIIVTYNSAGCINACVESARAQSGISFEIIVVDNASQDDTLLKLKDLKCRVIPSAENLGFGRGCNLAFDASHGRYLFLLNPDAQMIGTDFLKKLCAHLDDHPRQGMAGTRILSAAEKTECLPVASYPGQRHVRRDFSKLPGDIAWVIGASMMVRREVYERLGGFDPKFFLYSEETDFCLRLRELGFEIGYVPGIAVEHIGGASEDLRDPYFVSARKLQGLILFRQKHYAPADCIFLARRDLRRARLRMIWNGWLAKFLPPHSRAWQKHRQYHGIWETSKAFLAQAETFT